MGAGNLTGEASGVVELAPASFRTGGPFRTKREQAPRTTYRSANNLDAPHEHVRTKTTLFAYSKFLFCRHP